jgi:mannitol/fructose-specific phosphotransferase system IIA component (Ntr-type)
MNISRCLTEDLVKLELETVIEPPDENHSIERWRSESKEKILDELVGVLEIDSRIGNRKKLLEDFIHRERKATTAIGHGVAFPHIRSMQAKEFMIGFARSTEGYDFESPDEQPVHLFFIMAAPPYEDNFYLKVFKTLSEMLSYDSFREELMNVQSPGEVIRTIRAME